MISRPELLLAVGVGLDDVLAQLGDDPGAVGVVGVHLLEVDAHRVHLLELGVQLGDVPVLGEVALHVLLGHALGHLGQLLARGVRHVLALEDLVAVLVDDLALLVHHVVVLEDALADQEVLLLDLGLGALDLLGEHLGLDRLLLALLARRAQAVQDAVDPVAGEQAHQVVLGGQEEARLARVALAAGAAAELVVDPARLVALGADDVEAAGLHDQLAVLRDLGLVARVGLVPGRVVLVGAPARASSRPAPARSGARRCRPA